MAEARCERSDLLISQCGHCKGISDRPVAFEHVVETRIIAKYSGSCSSCGERVVAGETTIGVGAEGWVCEECIK